MTNKRLDFYIEMTLLFMLGVLAGVAIKTEANKFITIGFDDYKMKFSKSGYKINNLQNKILEGDLNNIQSNVPESNQE